MAETYGVVEKASAACWVWIPTLPLISFMSLSKLPNLFMSQFPHLENGDNRTYLIVCGYEGNITKTYMAME